MTDTDPDPIAELCVGLTVHGKPSLVWVVRWSEGGREPVAAAWAASCAPVAMASLLVRAGVEHSFSLSWDATNAQACDAIRRAVPVPTTLAELLTAAGAR